MKITNIKLQKNQKRFNIYLDGRFRFSLSALALAKANLKVDQVLSEKEIKRLKDKDVKDKLFDWALRFLSYRPRSEKELSDYLQKKGGKIKAAAATIQKLKRNDLVDDRLFAGWWIQQRSRFRPKGRYALRLELMKKGLEKEVVEENIQGLPRSVMLITQKQEILTPAQLKYEWLKKRLRNFQRASTP